MDEVVDYQRVADIMNRVDPDVIAVQELDSASVRSKTQWSFSARLT